MNTETRNWMNRFAGDRSNDNSNIETLPQPKSGSRVLVVDDEIVNCELMSYLVSQQGHEPVQSVSGHDALRTLESDTSIDLVLLDISMPEMDGFEVLERIRSNPRYDEVSVVMATATSDSQHTVRAFKLGANDYITKPIDPDTASIRINNQLKLKHTQSALLETQQRYALAAQGANDGLWDWDLLSNDVYYSRRWKTMLGFDEAEPISSPDAWLDRIHEIDRLKFDRILSKHLLGATKNLDMEFRIRHTDGSYRWVLCRGMAVRDETGTAQRIAGWLTDVTDGKVFDPLTGLPNRVMFLDRLQQCVDTFQAVRTQGFSVLFLDLDNFKLVNDCHGHAAGDEFLCVIADRLRSTCRNDGTMIARVGGDEFTITVENTKTPEQAITVANRILQVLSEPLEIEGQVFFPSLSIGISHSSDTKTTAEDMMQESDTAMYQAKANGKNCYQLYDPDMQQQARHRASLETELRTSIANSDFFLVYQPIINMSTGEMTGCESLVRWKHPERGIIGPGEFIQIAEETSLIVQIGDFVLQESCRQHAQWKSESPLFEHIVSNVNLSRLQLRQTGLAERVQEVLEQNGLEPDDLQLEITESSIFDRRGNPIKILSELFASGIHIALDDFGTGYSSLACLHTLPLSTLKIDRSFVSQMLLNKRSESIVRAIVTLAKGLNLKVCAEGIELLEHHDFLKSLNCEFAQGYYYGRPMPANELFEFAMSRNG